jgi:hypothetical protein
MSTYNGPIPRKGEAFVGILMRSGSNEPWSLLTSFQLAQYKTFGLAIEEAKRWPINGLLVSTGTAKCAAHFSQHRHRID